MKSEKRFVAGNDVSVTGCLLDSEIKNGPPTSFSIFKGLFAMWVTKQICRKPIWLSPIKKKG
jgi:hypothetical protein